MKLFLCGFALALVGAATAIVPTAQQPAAALDGQWSAFKTLHRKQYASADSERQRRLQWESNLAYIEKHNQAYARGEFGFDLAMNQLGDLHEKEVKDMLNGYRAGRVDTTNRLVFDHNAVGDIPDSIDWREKNLVTGVKTQGHCGACWAFSAVGSLEGQHAKSNKTLVPLSEQNLIDCSDKQGNNGCHGGWMDNAFKYVIGNGGIDTEESYPYAGRHGNCKFNKDKVGATILNYTDVESENEVALTAATATVGPISVAIDALGITFQFYHSGVYHGIFCSPYLLDHGVLAVGYGKLGDKEYYLVKNSWSEQWGQKGYVMMSRNRKNNCGIATKASFPVV